MATRILIERAQNGYCVRHGTGNLAEAPLVLVATWGELVDLLDQLMAGQDTRAFGDRESFPVLEALRDPSRTALERKLSEAPTVRMP